MGNKEYLVPLYDTRKSFYNKAYIHRVGSIIYLYSYDTLVLEVSQNYYKLNRNINDELLFSSTTLRHIKECLKQYYYHNNKILTKKDIMKESL